MIAYLFNYTSWDDWKAWLDDHAVPILLSVGGLLALHWFLKRFISRIFRHAISRAGTVRYVDPVVVKRRADTFTAVLTWALGVVLFFIGAGIVLSEFGLNISTLIAAAGIVGVALGLGAQLLVRDVLNGMFILIEDQYAVGDTITVAGVTGEVIEINPRRTVLRDNEGNVHVVPNSSITVATNRTAGLNRIVIDVEVAFREADEARTLVNEVAGELMTERTRDYATAPRVADVRALDDGDVLLRVVADASNGAKWEAEAELRRRLKRRFETERIEMRFGGAPEPEGAKA